MSWLIFSRCLKQIRPRWPRSFRRSCMALDKVKALDPHPKTWNFQVRRAVHHVTIGGVWLFIQLINIKIKKKTDPEIDGEIDKNLFWIELNYIVFFSPAWYWYMYCDVPPPQVWFLWPLFLARVTAESEHAALLRHNKVEQVYEVLAPRVPLAPVFKAQTNKSWLKHLGFFDLLKVACLF